ncbi:MAG: trimethylamine methyltransferase family protein [Chloroflexi bacterium]|nr:trimethylamine methyltransferase family protein [Chloroflexota bacterium]
MNITYHIDGGLGLEQLKRLHEEALGLIERVGLQVYHAPTLRRIAGQQDVHIEGNRVRFGPDLVARAVAAVHYPDEIAEAYAVISGAYEMNVTDLQTGTVRPSTYQDLVDLVKLGNSYGLYGSAPVRPLDLPSLLQELALYKVCYEYSDRRPGAMFDANPISSPQAARYALEMSQAVGQPLSLGLWIVSPFVATTENLEIIEALRGSRLPLWVATMPVAGTTAPITLAGAYLQSIAELLAGLTLIYLLADDAPVYYSIIDSIRAYPFDMRYASFVYGSPEDLLATLMQIQLNSFYHIPVVAKSLLTTAKLPDAHAAAEKSAHTLAAAMLGARIFTNAGLLAVDDIYSAEQVVVDYEIVQYVKRACQGLRFDDAALAVSAIEEVGLGGSFIGHESTLQQYRQATWDPALFTHSTLHQWQGQGSPELAARAREIARTRIAQQDYVLDADKRRELDKIYQRAARDSD